MAFSELDHVLAHGCRAASAVVGEMPWIESDGPGQRPIAKHADGSWTAAVYQAGGSNLHTQVEYDRRAAGLCLETVDRDDRRLAPTLRNNWPRYNALGLGSLRGTGSGSRQRKRDARGRGKKQQRQHDRRDPGPSEKIAKRGDPVRQDRHTDHDRNSQRCRETEPKTATGATAHRQRSHSWPQSAVPCQAPLAEPRWLL